MKCPASKGGITTLSAKMAFDVYVYMFETETSVHNVWYCIQLIKAANIVLQVPPGFQKVRN